MAETLTARRFFSSVRLFLPLELFDSKKENISTGIRCLAHHEDDVERCECPVVPGVLFCLSLCPVLPDSGMEPPSY